MSAVAAPVAAGVGVLGLAVGMLLNTVLYRVPSPWNVAGGTWRQYAVVEALTAGAFVALVLRFGVTAQLPAYLYLAAVGIVLAMLEFDVRRVPDVIVLPSYVVSVLLLMPAGAAQGDWNPAQRSLLGMAAFIVIFFVLMLAYPFAVTGSDVKLAGLLGLDLGWVSWGTVLIGMLGSFALVGFGGVALAGNRRPAAHAVPFAPCLILSAVLALLVTLPISTWYGSILGLA
ncbi:MAG: leader peptidase (prepilin peptidase) / N-methyltransferase [Pseudonocardiales bacterium]|nr:leader peptidase (prepilin peptidase) / N-methyltransferase [Pseudonocardiales bacterium]